MEVQHESEKMPVRIVVIGAGNRANKYLEYVRRNPDRAKLVAVVESNEIRCRQTANAFGLDASCCFSDSVDFFRHPIEADAVLICTPDNMHFKPSMLAIEAGYHILLEKPIAQCLEECILLEEAARKKHVMVVVCHVLRYHPYFMKIKELVESGELGEIISINHCTSIGVDRATHSFVRGLWGNETLTNPLVLSKCCHDVDFLLWLTGSRCSKLSSYGSLRWFRERNAPSASADRCVYCSMEPSCPFSAVDLYRNRKDWISNFDIPSGMNLDEVIEEQLKSGDYGRCIYRCNNDVVDHQVVLMEMENEVTVNFSMDVFTLKDNRETHVCMTLGEIEGDENTIRVRKFRGAEETVYDFSDIHGTPFHAGADLRLMECFIDAVHSGGASLPTSITESVEGHRVCYEAERSRKEARSLTFDRYSLKMKQ